MIEFIVGASVTAVASPVVRRLMVHRGVLDVPNHRSSHSVPTPRGGGLACAAGVLAGGVVAQILGLTVPWPIWAAVPAMAALGLLDDHRSILPLVRLAAQCVIGASLGAALGGTIGLLLGVLVVPASLNVVNFMDGIDGLTGITMLVWGGSAMLAGQVGHSAAIMVLGGVTAGAALGFLPSNFPKARLFLGDVGSYLFGGLVAAVVILGAVSGARMALLVAPLGLYLVDVGVTLVRRALEGASLLEAHRDHTYQQLTSAAGLPHRVVSLGAGLVSVLVTLAWLIPAAWVSSALTVVLLSLYLASPRLAKRRLPRSATTGVGSR